MGNRSIVDQRPAPPDRISVTVDEDLRGFLRAGRTAAGKLSQRSAARRAGISPVYWQKIESGRQQTAPAGTLAAMFHAVRFPVRLLTADGHKPVAAALRKLTETTSPEPSAEDYLAATPGASAEEVSALQAVWQALRARRTPDPVEPDFERSRRRNNK